MGVVLNSGKYGRFLNTAASNKIKPLGNEAWWEKL
jgi:hypothetical protein